MSSRFVSGGKIDAETGESVAPASTGEPEQAQNSKGHAQWEAVQRELDAERKRREDARRQAVEGGEKTLYDVLQANKGKSHFYCFAGGTAGPDVLTIPLG